MKLTYIDYSTDALIFNTNYKTELPQKAVLEIGVWKKQVDIEYSNEILAEHIGIPKKLFDGFRLPDSIDYSIKITERTIAIGPIIGFMPFSQEISLTKEVLIKKLPCFYRYDDIGGLIFICKPNNFCFENNTVEGYAYIPQNSPYACDWEENIFPLPSAIYTQVELTPQTYDKLLSRMGDKIFNSYCFNKLELWNYLCGYDKAKTYLPETIILKSATDAIHLLKKHKIIYLKPIYQDRSSNIMTFEKIQDDLYLLKNQDKSTNIYTLTELEVALEDLLQKEKYIAQQGIEIKMHKTLRYDFQVIMQKGYSMHWECTSIFTRFDEEDTSIANFKIPGLTMRGPDDIDDTFNLSTEKAFILEKEMVSAFKVICKKLDYIFGNYADLGIDIAIDKNYNIWILDVYKLDDYTFSMIETKNEQLYYELITKPFFYAKALSNF